MVIDGPLSNYNGNRCLSFSVLSKSQVGDWSLLWESLIWNSFWKARVKSNVVVKEFLEALTLDIVPNKLNQTSIT